MDSQNKRVLQLLKERGANGIASSEAYSSLYMPRLSARIKDLRDSGYNIESERIPKTRFVTYFLLDT